MEHSTFKTEDISTNYPVFPDLRTALQGATFFSNSVVFVNFMTNQIIGSILEGHGLRMKQLLLLCIRTAIAVINIKKNHPKISKLFFKAATF